MISGATARMSGIVRIILQLVVELQLGFLCTRKKELVLQLVIDYHVMNHVMNHVMSYVVGYVQGYIMSHDMSHAMSHCMSHVMSYIGYFLFIIHLLSRYLVMNSANKRCFLGPPYFSFLFFSRLFFKHCKT